jgi:hypothetical protein
LKGKCYYCNKELTERTIKRHIKTCSKIKEVISDEIKDNKKSRNQFIISMKDKYDKNTYCIYLSVDENLQLQHLDQFIRDVWVECCNHLSSFYINGMIYDDNRNELYQMNMKLKEVLSIGQKFEYQYDFGSTTHIILEVIDKIEVSKSHSQIEILARNNEINYVCSKCGKQAQYYNYETGSHICEECADKLDEEEIEELDGDYFNSPRDGVCGYAGDKDDELPYMPGNNNYYKISTKKPQLEDDEFDFFDNDINSYGIDSNNLLDKLLNYAATCNGKIIEDDVADILEEQFLNMHTNIFEKTTNEFLNGITKIFEKGVFSFELDELLNGYTKSQIKEIAENLSVKISSNSNKNTYIQKLNTMYLECMKNELYKMDDDKYNKLKKCVNNKGILNNVYENMHEYMFFMEKGILFPAIHNEEPVFVMPAIMQDVFNNMNIIEVRNKIKNNTEIINLFRGMIKAYGVISFDDTIMLLKKYIDSFDEINVIEILKENEKYYGEEYEIIEEEDIFSDNEEEIKLFVNFDIDEYEEVLLEIDNKLEYSDISKEKLIAMADSDYLEKSNLGKSFIKDLSKLFVMSKEEAIHNMDMLVLDVQIRSITEIIEEIINGMDVKIEKDDRFEIEQVINKLLKNIPIWKFKGATINQMEGEKIEEKSENKKVGRNEICPCGSGKKYKNCCGKVIDLFER